jgi:hypothetical protein
MDMNRIGAAAITCRGSSERVALDRQHCGLPGKISMTHRDGSWLINRALQNRDGTGTEGVKYLNPKGTAS